MVKVDTGQIPFELGNRVNRAFSPENQTAAFQVAFDFRLVAFDITAADDISARSNSAGDDFSFRASGVEIHSGTDVHIGTGAGHEDTVKTRGGILTVAPGDGIHLDGVDRFH